MKKQNGGYNILFKFNKWSRERIAKGTKRATTRLTRHGSIGDRFNVGSEWFEIERIQATTLKTVVEKYYKIEGAKSSSEFKAVWKEIHSRAVWNDEKIVFIHFFKKVDARYDTGSKGMLVQKIIDVQEQ